MTKMVVGTLAIIRCHTTASSPLGEEIKLCPTPKELPKFCNFTISTVVWWNGAMPNQAKIASSNGVYSPF
jgi:hypothetical protein